MSARRDSRADELQELEVLDADTSAAILHWMETDTVPEGVDPDGWRRWAESGCEGSIRVRGVALTPAMLGHWARTGLLP